MHVSEYSVKVASFITEPSSLIQHYICHFKLLVVHVLRSNVIAQF